MEVYEQKKISSDLSLIMGYRALHIVKQLLMFRRTLLPVPTQ